LGAIGVGILAFLAKGAGRKVVGAFRLGAGRQVAGAFGLGAWAQSGGGFWARGLGGKPWGLLG
jgi:hypothetical protein